MRVSGAEPCEYSRKLLPQLWYIGGKQIAMSAYTEDERDSFRPWTTVGIRRFRLHEVSLVGNAPAHTDIARNGRPSVIGQL
jgi:hypothetical protein